MVCVAVLALVCTGLWLGAVEPLERGLAQSRSRLSAELALQQELRALAAEAEALRARLPPPRPPGQSLLAAVRGALDQSPLASTLQLEAVDEGRVRLRAQRLHFDRFTPWLEGLLKDLGLRIESLELTAHADPGHVAGRLVLVEGAPADG